MSESYIDRDFEELIELAKKKPAYNKVIDNNPEGLQKYENIIKRLYYLVRDKWLNKKFEEHALKIRAQAYVLSIMDIFDKEFIEKTKYLLDSEEGKEKLRVIMSELDDKNIESLLK